MELYTIQISQHRKLIDTNIELVDVTIKSASPTMCKLFAPNNFKLVMNYKLGKITEEEYTEKYLSKLRYTSEVYEDEWKEFLKRDKVALGCYCKKGDFCHRHLLSKYILEFCSEQDIDIIYKGEFNG